MMLARPVGLALLAAALFGAGVPASKVLLADLPPFQLAGLLYLGAALGVAPVAAISGGLRFPRARDRNRLRVKTGVSPLARELSFWYAQRTMTLAAGARLGRYVIEAPLGAGGLGDVYLAADTGLHRRVALKLMLAASADVDTARRRLVREAQAAAGLDHPNIFTIYEVGEADGHS